jgi:hypothetical protein
MERDDLGAELGGGWRWAAGGRFRRDGSRRGAAHQGGGDGESTTTREAGCVVGHFMLDIEADGLIDIDAAGEGWYDSFAPL